MQINLSTNLAGPTGEATSKSTETGDTESASSFFTQMGQLWNPDSEDADAPSGEAPDVQKTGTTVFNPISMRVGTTMLSINPMEAEPASNSNLPDPAFQVLPDGSFVCHGNQEIAPEEMQDDDSEKAGAAAIADSLFEPIEQELPKTLVTPVMPDSSSLPAKGISDAADASPQLEAVAEPTMTSGPEMEAAEDISSLKAGIPESRQIEVNGKPDFPYVFEEAITEPETDLAEASQASAKPQADTIKPQESRPPAFLNAVPDSGFEPKDSGFSRILRTESQKDEQGPIPVSDELEEVLSALSEPDGQNRKAESPAMPEMRQIRSVLKPALQSEGEIDPAISSMESAMETEPEYKRPSMPVTGSAKNETGAVDQPHQSRDSRTDEKLLSPEITAMAKNRTANSHSNSDTGSAQPTGEEGRHPLTAQQIVKGKGLDEHTPPSQKTELSIPDRLQETPSTPAAAAGRAQESGDFAASLSSSSAKIQSRELVFQLADQIQVQLRDGKSVIRIQLKPDILGRIEIKAETTLSGVTARITTESGDVKTYLENNLQLLQQTLNDQGLRVDRIHVIVQDALDSRSSSGYGTQFGHAGSGRNGQDPDASPNASGSSNMSPSDELNVDPQTWLAMNPNSRFYTVA